MGVDWGRDSESKAVRMAWEHETTLWVWLRNSLFGWKGMVMKRTSGGPVLKLSEKVRDT